MTNGNFEDLHPCSDRRVTLQHGRHCPHRGGPVSPDNGQFGERHGRQGEAIREGDEFHCPRALGGRALQALSHVFLF